MPETRPSGCDIFPICGLMVLNIVCENKQVVKTIWSNLLSYIERFSRSSEYNTESKMVLPEAPWQSTGKRNRCCQALMTEEKVRHIYWLCNSVLSLVGNVVVHIPPCVASVFLRIHLTSCLLCWKCKWIKWCSVTILSRMVGQRCLTFIFSLRGIHTLIRTHTHAHTHTHTVVNKAFWANSRHGDNLYEPNPANIINHL